MFYYMHQKVVKKKEFTEKIEYKKFTSFLPLQSLDKISILDELYLSPILTEQYYWKVFQPDSTNFESI